MVLSISAAARGGERWLGAGPGRARLDRLPGKGAPETGLRGRFCWEHRVFSAGENSLSKGMGYLGMLGARHTDRAGVRGRAQEGDIGSLQGS